MQTRSLALALALTWALTAPAHSQTRTPRFDTLLTANDRALIVEAFNGNGRIANNYRHGAPLFMPDVPAIEAALTKLNTPAATALIAKIEAAKPAAKPAPVVPLTGTTKAALTFADGYAVSWAEYWGPQFLLELSPNEIAVIQRAMDKLAEEHYANPRGIDDYLYGRSKRILDKLSAGGFGIFLGAERLPEVAYPMTTPEMTLTGFAVSRDRYRKAPEPEAPSLVARLWDWFMGTAVAQAESIESIHNREAIALADKLAAMKHTTPGGRP